MAIRKLCVREHVRVQLLVQVDKWWNQMDMGLKCKCINSVEHKLQPSLIPRPPLSTLGSGYETSYHPELTNSFSKLVGQNNLVPYYNRSDDCKHPISSIHLLLVW